MSRSRVGLGLLLGSLLLAPALAPAQQVVVWGDNNYGQAAVPAVAQSGVVAVATNTYHILALKADGGVVAWGWNDYGQTAVPAAAQSGVVAVAAGGVHSLALKADGGVVAWGFDNFGQVSVPAAAQSGVTAIAAGTSHSLALKADGGVVAWGSNSEGQTTVPATAQSGVVAIAGGGFHSLALKANGSVVAWGHNFYGETTVPAATLSGVKAIAAGFWHSLALKADGSVVAWGGNELGQLNFPPALSLPGSKVAGISAGAYHSLVLYELCQVDLAPSTVYAGDASQATVRLVDPAPAGGAVVSLASNDATVHVPDSVTVPAGSRTATFMVNTDPALGPDRTAKVTATYGGASVDSSFTLKGVTASVAFDHPDIAGGSTTGLMLKVRLGAALGSDATFSLSSTGPLLGVPATVTVPAGSTEVKTPLTTPQVATQQTAAATLSYNGTSLGTANILVKPVRGTIKFASDPVPSGSTTQGTVYLSAATLAPVTVQLASGSPYVGVEASVTVPAGGRSAPFTIGTVTSIHTLDVPVTATVGSVSFSATLRLSAMAAVKSLTGPSVVYGGAKATFTVTLNRPAGPGGYGITPVAIFGSPISVPASVIVPEGASSVSFEAVGGDADSVQPALLTAYGPANSASAQVSVRPNVPAAFTLSASTVASGGSFTGTVTLKAAVAGDTVVQLSSGDPLVEVPPTVTIPAGSKTGTFIATVGTAAKATNMKITATKSGVSLAKGVKVLPAPPLEGRRTSSYVQRERFSGPRSTSAK